MGPQRVKELPSSRRMGKGFQNFAGKGSGIIMKRGFTLGNTNFNLILLLSNQELFFVFVIDVDFSV